MANYDHNHSARSPSRRRRKRRKRTTKQPVRRGKGLWISAPIVAVIVAALTFIYQKHGPTTDTAIKQIAQRQHTAKVDGRWEVVDTQSGSVVHWRGVNVRTDQLLKNPLGTEDLQAIAERFNTIRLPMLWSQLETQDNVYADPLVSAIRQVLDIAESLGINVILDPVHLGGGSTFWIPEWVWNSVLPNVEPSKSRSFPILGSDQLQDYMDWVMLTFGAHDAVVAVEVVNEPHPQDSKDAWKPKKQTALLNHYESLIKVIRKHRPNIIVVLGSYYGGHLFNSGEKPYVNTIRETFGSMPNLVWTAHSYFTGIEQDSIGPDYDNDGYADNDGQGVRGVRGAGTWAEQFDSAGCYTESGRKNPDTAWTCNPDMPAREFALQGHSKNAANHDKIAQEANMPFFMGEWGMGRIRKLDIDDDGELEDIGWGGVHEFMCDRIKAYRDIYLDGTNQSISWAVWSFDARVDGGFGLYNGDTNEWIADTSDAFASNPNCDW